MIHSRNGFTVIDLLTQFGGLYAILYKLFEFIAISVSKDYLQAKLSRALYYTKVVVNDEKDDENENFETADN